MRITPENVGDIIRTEHGAGHILIEAVTDELVQYRQETGDRYATFDHDLPGCVVRDEARIREFYENVELGSALNHAEYSAICGLLSSPLSHEQRVDAASVLQSVKSMKERLVNRIQERDQRETGKLHHSLDALISRAAGNAKSQQAHAPHVLSGLER